jgi:hypothetical protein
VLGFALARASLTSKGRINLFCSLTDIKRVLKGKFRGREKLLNASVRALEAGYKALNKSA